MQDFAGRIAVVTGAASGIGRALARRLAAEGMQVALGDVEGEALEATVEELRAGGATALGVRCDVSDPDEVERLAEQTEDRLGTPHVVCLNAGVAGGGLSWEVPVDEWAWVLDVNLWGVIHGVRTFTPRLMTHDDAHVVVTASMAGLVAGPFMGPYNASKHAAVAIAQTLHHEQQLHGGAVKVHALCPGWVRTAIADADRNRPAHRGGPGARGGAVAANRDAIREVLAAGMDPDEVAGAVVQAMRDERFWVLTHRGEMWDASVEAVQRSLREGTNPSFGGG